MKFSFPNKFSLSFVEVYLASALKIGNFRPTLNVTQIPELPNCKIGNIFAKDNSSITLSGPCTLSRLAALTSDQECCC